MSIFEILSEVYFTTAKHCIDILLCGTDNCSNEPRYRSGPLSLPEQTDRSRDPPGRRSSQSKQMYAYSQTLTCIPSKRDTQTKICRPSNILSCYKWQGFGIYSFTCIFYVMSKGQIHFVLSIECMYV